MAFQGKGILGGFSGKVGSIVGYKRNGKDVMQSIGKRKGDVTRVVFKMINQLLVNPFNATVGEYFCWNDVLVQDGNNGAESALSITEGKCSLEFTNQNGCGNTQVGFTNHPTSYRGVFMEVGVLMRNNQYRVYIHNVLVMILGGNVAGDKYKIDIDKDKTRFYRDNGSGEWVLFFDQVITYTYPLKMVVNTFVIDDRVSELKMGAFNLA